LLDKELHPILMNRRAMLSVGSIEYCIRIQSGSFYEEFNILSLNIDTNTEIKDTKFGKLTIFT